MLRSPRISPILGTGPVHPPGVESSTSLRPRALEQLLRIKGDLRLGLPVVIHDTRETLLLALVESLSADRFAAITAMGSPELVVTRRRARALGIDRPGSAEVLRMPVPADATQTWLAAVAGQYAQDGHPPRLSSAPLLPGSPIQAAAVKLAKAAQAMPAVLTLPFAGDASATGLMAMALGDLDAALDQPRRPDLVSSAPLPMEVAEGGQVHVFRPDDGGPEHYAIEVGTPSRTGPVTVRLHSACFTGDVLGSLRCDCGPQLRAAMSTMAAEGGGLLLYLNQEGRGIGLANKMRTYVLQNAGLDTVEANHWLGFDDDQRDFRIGASILQSLNISRVRLMTNNPAKVSILAGHGIDVVERVPLRAGHTPHNAHYLATKALKSGHLL